ncbi:MAG: sugar phosphate isomerase/epimerase, partial [Lentisphaeria bacterium]|nr:sugar phosphate isomerase/epimerase [Lentisphaeria bacterium]
AHAPFRRFADLFIPEERDRRLMLARQKLNLLLVNEMGVRTCTFHVGSEVYPEYSAVAHREAIYRSLDELLPFAEKLDIAIALENGRIPFNTADELIACVRRYDSPYLGLCLDVGHANLKEHLSGDSEHSRLWEDCGLPYAREENIAERMRPYIVNCHLHDNFGERDDHDLPGCGNIDWGRILPLLRNAPRLKCLQSEVLTARRNIPIREVTESMRRLLGYL